MTDKRQIELFDMTDDPAVIIFEAPPPSDPIRDVWLEIQKRAHELKELISTTPTPVRGKVDSYLVDKIEIISSHIDRIITPLKEDDNEPKEKA